MTAELPTQVCMNQKAPVKEPHPRHSKVWLMRPGQAKTMGASTRVKLAEKKQHQAQPPSLCCSMGRIRLMSWLHHNTQKGLTQ